MRRMRDTIAALAASATMLAAVAGGPASAQQQPAGNVPTFSTDVAPIVYKHCVSCHRPGEIAPMSLLTYEQARPYARAIANAVTNRTMPPWHAEAPAGTFHNERLLSDAERQTLTAWAAGGEVKGDPGDLTATPVCFGGRSLYTTEVGRSKSEHV